MAEGDGRKGLHVSAPVADAIDWAQAKAYTRDIAERVAATAPARYTTSAALSKRPGRLFIDYLRNGRGTTARGVLAAGAAGLPDRGACHVARGGERHQGGCVNDSASALAAAALTLCGISKSPITGHYLFFNRSQGLPAPPSLHETGTHREAPHERLAVFGIAG